LIYFSLIHSTIYFLFVLALLFSFLAFTVTLYLFPSISRMKYAFVLTAIAAIASKVAAVGVSGTPEGFASSATGGGDATPVYPSSTDELVSYLGDSEARVIVLSKT
jgi:O-antigen ligase